MNVFFNMTMLVAVLLLTICKVSSAQILLPSDPVTAHRMLGDGTLDSAEWQLLEPFYYLPLNVPAGEVVALTKIYPSLQHRIPQPSVLEKYIPWTEDDIIRFFSDYPELIDFQPVLEFKYYPAAIHGRLVVTGNKSEYDPLAQTKMQFALEPHRSVAVRGRVKLTEEYVRWYERTLSIALPAGITADAGTIDGFDDQGLLLGYFPSSTDTAGSSIVKNWLYGSGHDWNGVRMRYTHNSSGSKAGVRAAVIAHKQVSEEIAGLTTELRFKNDNSLHAGIAGVRPDSSLQNKLYSYIMYGCNYTYWHCAMTAGCDLCHPGTVPLNFFTQHDFQTGKIICRIIHFPQTENLPYSKYLHSLEQVLENDSECGSITRIQLENHYSKKDCMRINGMLELTMTDVSPHLIVASINISGNVKAIRYVSRVSTHVALGRSESYSLVTSVSAPLNTQLKLIISHNSEISDNRGSLKNGTVSLAVRAADGIDCKPSVLLDYSGEKNGYRVKAGITADITFLYGTITQLRFDCPVQAHDMWKGSNLECKGTFAF